MKYSPRRCPFSPLESTSALLIVDRPWEEVVLGDDGEGGGGVGGLADHGGARGGGPEGRVVLVVQVGQHYDHLHQGA